MNGFFNWKDSFELPHESNWGLYQKKCFLNGYKIKRLSYYHSSINHSKNIAIDNNLSSHPRYCPICAKYGYHAWFHQLQFLDKCLIHPNQALVYTDFSPYIAQEQTFFEAIQTRIIDIIKNDALRQEIEKNIQLDFDYICVIDPMEYERGAQKSFRPRWYNSTLQTLKEYFTHEAFSVSRKIAVLTPDTEKEIYDRAEAYLEQKAIPHHISRIQTLYPNEYVTEDIRKQGQYIQQKWYDLRTVDFVYAHISLILHEYFF